MFLKCSGETSFSRRQYPTVIEELCHQFSLTDLGKSTDNFDQNRIIGCGKSGKVYKGCLQHNDASDYTVAIKRFQLELYQAWGEFKNEIELLCQLRHPNCVSLIGFCNHKKEKILVLEYMSNGSLYQHLRRGELSWKKRLEICVGAARGLHYLHAGTKRTIIHRNIKPGTILLDDNMETKLGGFGISVQGGRCMSKPKPIKVDSLSGSWDYMPREYLKDRVVTDKYDVYSFGVVLLEVLWGKTDYLLTAPAIKLMENPVEESIDPNMKGKIAPQCWQVYIDIIHRCIKYEPDERPTMGDVEMRLQHALALQKQADITNINADDYTLFSKTIIPHPANKI